MCKDCKVIKEVTNEDLKRALDLVNKVFSEFVAIDYSEQGRNTFEEYLKIKYDEITSDLQEGNKKIWAFYQNGEILGVIAIRDVSHIALLFVDKRYHRQGIARQLFQFVLTEIRRQHPEATLITVNSSPFAVAAYEHLGFVQTADQQESDGIIFVPMACNLVIDSL